MQYNGHKNWGYWNVSLWINNDEGLYNEAINLAKIYKPKRRAAQAMLENLHEVGITETPDGAEYTVPTIRAAMADM